MTVIKNLPCKVYFGEITTTRLAKQGEKTNSLNDAKLTLLNTKVVSFSLQIWSPVLPRSYLSIIYLAMIYLARKYLSRFICLDLYIYLD